MNPSQQKMYWAEFQKAWRVLLTLGRKPADREAERKRMHIRIGAVDRKGQPLSSTHLSNRNIDRFLALCRSYSAPANLQAQLDLDAQPTKRALVACEPLLDELGMHHDQREAYVAGIYRNVQRGRARVAELREMPDEDLGLVLAALGHTVRHKLGIDHNHPQTGRGRARWGHRVGKARLDAEPVDAHLEPALPRESAPEMAPSEDDGDPF